ncbi:hypothetical protein G7Y89_g965 [Cudoniella acicularis]|uniref:Cytochrome b5 heme-binding domain-containing protein n=1 Tax=Cudoniella acicularis TaxID=354080 RepID=A0A8H4RX86_9HELO|nr:hypothetical protein G7Y89_g965 [Cudoniella acicularis]
MSKTFTQADVASHNKPDNLYVTIDEDVYDLTQFQDEHPGGKKILTRVAGKDATKQFWKYHNEGILKKYKAKLQVGSLNTKKNATPPTPPAKEAVKPKAESGAVVPVPSKAAREVVDKTQTETLDPFGELIPFADPSWYQGFHSPYFNETHAALREEVREWVSNEIEPFVGEWDEARKVPDSIYKAMGTRGYLAGLMGMHYPVDYTDNRIKSVPPEKWDLFHEMLLTDELSRAASGGFVWNVIGGFGIGCPPLVKFGKKEVVKRVLPGILNGDKRICLAITEPDAGSDVANLTCEAKLTPDGKHYIVNGEKKWITNGIWCDYFTTAVRTGTPESGMNGVSVLLIERIIMTNFNHERIGIIIQCLRFSRVCYEESIKYAHKRRTFGKKLIEHPVIRLKLAHMARQIEASYSWLESLIHQISHMPEQLAMLRLGGPIASLKAQATVTFEFCAREASQIFGGLSYSRGGQGGKVERLYRDVRAYAIPGGSEEIMLDLSIRQSLRVGKVMAAAIATPVLLADALWSLAAAALHQWSLALAQLVQVHGYIDYKTAALNGLATTDGTTVYLGTDYQNQIDPNGNGRDGIQITSKQTFTHGLIISDVANMPGGICGVGGGHRSIGNAWPADGEIDIVAGTTVAANNIMTLFTDDSSDIDGSPDTCFIIGDGETGTLLSSDCTDEDSGCNVQDSSDVSYGENFNENGGGVYATQWTSDYIRIWFFDRGDGIPDDITSGNPDPSGWGTPSANFENEQSSCPIDDHFIDHKIVFDIDFCGDIIDSNWSDDPICGAVADSCEDWVAQNPANFTQAYWAINSIKVYQIATSEPADPTAATTTSSPLATSPSVAPSVSASSPSPIVVSTPSSASPLATGGPSIEPVVGGYEYYGCYIENAAGRVLGEGYSHGPGITLESCAATCTGFLYFGTEYADECYCGNSFEFPTSAVSDTDCSMICAGDDQEFCGGWMRISVYSLVENSLSSTVVPTAASSNTPSYSQGPSSYVATSSSTAPVSPVASPSGPSAVPAYQGDTPQIWPTVGEYSYQGCWTENPDYRILPDYSISYSDMTLESCASYCANVLASGTTQVNDLQCSMVCGGDPGEFCGNAMRISLFKLTAASPSSSALPTATVYNLPSAASTIILDPGSSSSTYELPTPATTIILDPESISSSYELPTPATTIILNPESISSTSATAPLATATDPMSIGNFALAGCYTNPEAWVTLALAQNSNTMTPQVCVGLCQDSPFAAVHDGYCYCGSSLPNTSSPTSDDSCTIACPGDKNQICGGNYVVPRRSLNKRQGLGAPPATFLLTVYANSHVQQIISSSSSTVVYSTSSSTVAQSPSGTLSSSIVAPSSVTSKDPSSPGSVQVSSSAGSTTISSKFGSASSISSTSTYVLSSPNLPQGSSSSMVGISTYSSSIATQTSSKSVAQSQSSGVIRTQSVMGPSTAVSYSRSTVYQTTIYTITSCAPTVTNCPALIGKLTTVTIPAYTTICPVSPAPTQPSVSTGIPTKTSSVTISTVYATSVYTVTSCAPTVTNCPALIGKLTTVTVPLYTTICPLATGSSSASVTPVTFYPNNPTTRAPLKSVTPANPSFKGVPHNPVPPPQITYTTVVITSYVDICPAGFTIVTTSQTQTKTLRLTSLSSITTPSASIPMVTKTITATIRGSVTTATLTVPYVPKTVAPGVPVGNVAPFSTTKPLTPGNASGNGPKQTQISYVISTKIVTILPVQSMPAYPLGNTTLPKGTASAVSLTSSGVAKPTYSAMQGGSNGGVERVWWSMVGAAGLAGVALL